MEEMAAAFKALSDPNRLAIFEAIRRCGALCGSDGGEGSSCVSDIAERFDLALSTVSHHIKELRNSGLVVCEKEGRWVYCRVDDGTLERVASFLESGSGEPREKVS